MKFLRYLAIIAAVLLPMMFLSPYSRGQDDGDGVNEDKFVRLMSAQSLSIIEQDGKNYRKAVGPARFLHNDTWLICDTALWSVDEELIYAIGNVSIEQEQTELRSDRLTYFVDRNTAEFRGSLVQLSDKDGNMLRTGYLDYNTKDSVAVFSYGGSFRDKDGQIIESVNGTYDAKAKLFTFLDDVDMFTDSAFVKTPELWYDSGQSLVTFPDSVDMWKDDYMMSGRHGWYDREREVFFFRDKVHSLSDDREGWSDTLYYYRKLKDIDMLGNVQLNDEQRQVSVLAGRVHYVDTFSRVYVYNDPLIMMRVDEKSKEGTKRDSVYMTADEIVYETVMRFKVDSSLVADAAGRLEEAAEDPVANIRAKAREEELKRIKEAIESDPNVDSLTKEKYAFLFADDSLSEADAEKPEPVADGDSLSVRDSLALADSLSRPPDSTRVGFLFARGGVKVFRKSLQASCDSLLYSDLDSLARLYIDPIVWNESGRHQYTADSIFLSVKNGSPDKAFLLSSAFVAVQETTNYFDQIRSAEMTAYFDGDSQLYRYDALGGASATFFLREKNEYTNMNKSESTIMSVDFKDGEVSKVTYFESPKSDVHPVPQTSETERRMKGFEWLDDQRPRSPFDLSLRRVRPGERSHYTERPHAVFKYTLQYFPGYMDKVYREIALNDSLKNVIPAPVADSLSFPDTTERRVLESAAAALAAQAAAPVVLPDSLQSRLDSIEILFNEVLQIELDSLNNPLLYLPDSVRYAPEPELTPAQRRAAEAKARKQERIRLREARWAELDARDAAKLEKKEAARRARKEKNELRQKKRIVELKLKEDRLREKYKQKLLKKGNL